MTIRSTTPAYSDPRQRTQATTYYDGLADRFAKQARANVPRSERSWGAEQNRLGSWNTGVGSMRSPGVGASFLNGEGKPAFSFDPEDPDLERGAQR